MGHHPFVVYRSDSRGRMLDQVCELVAESDSEKHAAHYYESLLPSQFPDHEGDYCCIKRCPYEFE